MERTRDSFPRAETLSARLYGFKCSLCEGQRKTQEAEKACRILLKFLFMRHASETFFFTRQMFDESLPRVE